MHNKRFIAIMVTAALLLLIPAVAMQFSTEVKWEETDFIVAGLLLFGTGILFELAARKAAKAGNTTAYRAGAAMALGTVLFLIWSNLAVGIIGSEDNPANLMYLTVLAIAFIGSIFARFQSRGMAYAMFAAAAAQAIVTLIAIIGRMGLPWSGPAELIMINSFFIALWIGSALLFRAAATPPQRVLNHQKATS